MSCFAWRVSDDRALLIQQAPKNKLGWTRRCILITDIVSRRLCLDFSYSFPDNAAGGEKDSQTCTEQFYPSARVLYPKLSWECSEKWVLLLLALDVSFERFTGEKPASRLRSLITSYYCVKTHLSMDWELPASFWNLPCFLIHAWTLTCLRGRRKFLKFSFCSAWNGK